MKNHIEKELQKYKTANNITAKTKIRYYLERLIPNMEYYKNHVPLIYRHKWLMPFFVVFRMIRGLIKNGGSIKNEIKLVFKIKV